MAQHRPLGKANRQWCKCIHKHQSMGKQRRRTKPQTYEKLYCASQKWNKISSCCSQLSFISLNPQCIFLSPSNTTRQTSHSAFCITKEHICLPSLFDAQKKSAGFLRGRKLVLKGIQPMCVKNFCTYANKKIKIRLFLITHAHKHTQESTPDALLRFIYLYTLVWQK